MKAAFKAFGKVRFWPEADIDSSSCVRDVWQPQALKITCGRKLAEAVFGADRSLSPASEPPLPLQKFGNLSIQIKYLVLCDDLLTAFVKIEHSLGIRQV